MFNAQKQLYLVLAELAGANKQKIVRFVFFSCSFFRFVFFFALFLVLFCFLFLFSVFIMIIIILLLLLFR